MGENARFKIGHALVETHVLKTPPFQGLSRALLDRVSAHSKTSACRMNALKHSYAVKCGNRLRVGVRSKNASVPGLRVSPLSWESTQKIDLVYCGGSQNAERGWF